MRSRLLPLVLTLAACGGDDGPAGSADANPDPPDAEVAPPDGAVCPTLTGTLEQQIASLPHVVSVEPVDATLPSHTCFQVGWEQPVNHDDPGGATFTQYSTLCHGDPAAPMVILSSGYWDMYGSYPEEITQILDANQISLEHRF